MIDQLFNICMMIYIGLVVIGFIGFFTTDFIKFNKILRKIYAPITILNSILAIVLCILK